MLDKHTPTYCVDIHEVCSQVFLKYHIHLLVTANNHTNINNNASNVDNKQTTISTSNPGHYRELVIVFDPLVHGSNTVIIPTHREPGNHGCQHLIPTRMVPAEPVRDGEVGIGVGPLCGFSDQWWWVVRTVVSFTPSFCTANTT